jgi:putative hydrolase of the HAD superfamily
MIKAILFDFGGVLAEEGFREGLLSIARKNGFDPGSFFKTANELVFTSGYLTGRSDESAFFNAMRETTRIHGSDSELRDEILKRFNIRPEMISHVQKIKSAGLITGILSDQTDWLDILNEKTPFYQHFDYIFNSFKIHKSKREPSVFREVCAAIGIKSNEVLFVDDNEENIQRASGEGLITMHFKNMDDFKKEIKKIFHDMINS